MTPRHLAPFFTLIALTPAFATEPEVGDVFVPAADGFKSIRIPAVVVTNAGTVLAFAEGRAANADHAENKLLLKRSTDNGKTWGELAVVAEDGKASMNNPCVVVERASGRVVLMYQVYPAGTTERNGKIRPGYDEGVTVRNRVVTSDDDGKTWSPPRDVTRETKREQVVTTVASGPGVGVQLRHGPHAGRLVIPFNEGPYGSWNVYVVFSDDGGKTWAMGGVAPGGLVDNPKGGKTSQVNEVQVVEVGGDGSLRLNARRWAGKPVRKTAVSRDGGATWSAVEDVPELADPSCMGSIVRLADPFDGGRGGPNRVLYSGPQSTKRENGTVFLSTDDGRTWPVKRVLCPGRFAYSCLTPLPDGTIGCLYEADGTAKVVFARFTLDWLTGSPDRPMRPNE